MASKKQKKVSKNYMDAIIYHNPEYKWTEKDNGTVVIDVINKGFYHKIAQKFFHKPKVSHISLDKYGSLLWKSINGKNTVYDIVNTMSDKFPGESDRMLDRVITFLHTLEVNRFIYTSVSKSKNQVNNY